MRERKIARAFSGIVAFLLILASCSKNKQEVSQKAVASVGSETVTEEELEYFENRLKAEVMNQVLRDYSVTYSDDFWTKTYGNKTPQQILSDEAFEQCVTAKLELIECKKLGIYDDITFAGLRAKANAFNTGHEEASGSVGIKSIDLSQFYTYYVENGVLELKNKLADTTLKPTDSEINAQLKKLGVSAKKSLSEAEQRAAAKQAASEVKFNAYMDGLKKNTKITKY